MWSNMLRSASARPTWLDCQRSAVLLPHFRSVLSAKDLMFRFRTSALPWLPKICSSASALSVLPKIWSSTSALSFCIDCQKCEVPLPHFRSALTVKDLKFRFPHLFCQDFERCGVPLTHFICSSLLPWLQKICSFTFQICLHSQRCECTSALPWLPKFCLFSSALGSYYVFPHNFVLSYMKD